MSKRIKVTIEKQTDRAFLVTDGTRKGWVMNRSLSDELTVIEKTFAKAADEFAKREANYIESKKDRKINLASAVRETEKAFAFDVTIVAESTDQEIKRTVWIPKSQIKDGVIPAWLVNAKEDDLLGDFRTRYMGEYFYLANQPWS